MTQHSTHSTFERLPWHDRWSQPDLKDLLRPLRSHQRRVMDNLIHHLDEQENVEQSLRWFGPSWKWTIHYTALDAEGEKLDDLCFLVPDTESPAACIPLSDDLIDRFPQKMPRYIKDGIKTAKHAVAIHWASWTPSNNSEVGHLTDVLDRKLTYLRELQAV